jgi:hypothetical protein
VNHIVHETREAHDTIPNLPAGSVVIAENGTGDLLLLLAHGDEVAWWDHETGQTEPVTLAGL